MHYVTVDEGFTSPNERTYFLSRPIEVLLPYPFPPHANPFPHFHRCLQAPMLLQCFNLNLRHRTLPSRHRFAPFPTHPTRPLRCYLRIRLAANKLWHHGIRVVKRHRAADVDFKPRHVARGLGVAVDLYDTQISLLPP